MRSAIDALDWARTPIGPREQWPQTLRTTLSLVLDSPFPMLIMWGPQLVQLYNQGYVPIFGDKHAHALGQDAATCWADIWDDVGPLLLGVYERGEAVYFENLQLPMQRNGRHEEAYFTFSYSPIRDGDQILGVICVVNETTAHVLREREMQERAEALAALDRAKTQFFNNISHEFRTPLTLMLGPLEDLVRTLPEYEQRQTADLARRNAVRLQKLVDALLDYSAAQSGVVEPHRTLVDIDQLTIDLVSEFRAAYDRAGLTLERHARVGRDVAIDRVMYEKVLLNLLSNALKFTFVGGVRVLLEPDADDVVLRVTDTGIGIAKEDVDHLFDRFSRVHGARSRTHEGSGIGLALVRELVALQGGTISVESAPGVGSTFTVRLPVSATHPGMQHFVDTHSLRRQYREEAEALTQATQAPSATRVGADAPLVLVADDNDDLRAYLSRVLGAKYNVRTCGDGDELVRLAELCGPDVIVADVMMPRVDGFEALRRLRSSPRTAQIPVIVLSARAGLDAASDAFARGVDDYVVKPFVATDLLARVDAVLRRTRPRPVASTERGYTELASNLADRFISAVSVASVFEALTQTLTPAFAQWSSVSTVTTEGRIVPQSIRHAEPAKTELGYLLDREYPVFMGDEAPLPNVLNSGQPFMLGEITPAQIREGARDERHAAILNALELRSAIVVPIRTGDTTVAAITVVRSAESPTFTDADLNFMMRIAARSALAYESARVHERERTIATTLQRALLPSALPSVPGLRFSASYAPASQESMVGGDWYDAFAIDQDRIVVSIGDVVGHGFDAATVMATLRQSVRSLAIERRDPSEILAYLNRLLFAERSGRLATAFVAVVDPQTLHVQVASAGHSPALRIDSRGECFTLSADGLVLGVDDDAQYRSQTYYLESGDLVAFYTDGYVEESRDLAQGEERFIAALGRARNATDPATAVHLDIFGQSAPRDDAALLAMIVDPALDHLDATFPARPEMAAQVRSAIRRFLEGTTLSEERRFDLVLAAGEATINAIEHAFSGREPGSLHVIGRVEGDVVVIEVADDGLGWDARATDDVQRGYGLPLMHALTDGVDIVRGSTGTRVRLSAALTPLEAAV